MKAIRIFYKDVNISKSLVDLTWELIIVVIKYNLHDASLQRSKTPCNKYPANETKLSDGESTALELWGM